MIAILVGDAGRTAELEAAQLTRSEPHRQLQASIRAIVEKPDLSDQEKLARLRAEIPKLPGDPGPGAVEALRSKYPELSDKQWAMVQKSVDGAVQGEHQRFLDSLANFEQSHNEGSNPESLSEWMRRWGMY